jgi:hypothetical protein
MSRLRSLIATRSTWCSHVWVRRNQTPNAVSGTKGTLDVSDGDMVYSPRMLGE